MIYLIISLKRGNVVSRQVAPLNLYNNTRMRTNLCIAKRQSRTALNQKSNACASRPYIEGRLACYRKRLVFRLSSTPKRLLENSQWRLCLGAITEFTAAGQSEIHTPVPN